MLYIENTLIKVIILVASECSDLRLLPGLNEIDVKDKKDLDPYLSNKVAQGLLNGYEHQVFNYEKIDNTSDSVDNFNKIEEIIRVQPAIRFVDYKLNDKEKAEATYARTKNDMLNKSPLIITDQSKKVKKEVEKKVDIVDEQRKQIDKLTSIIKDLTPSTKIK